MIELLGPESAKIGSGLDIADKSTDDVNDNEIETETRQEDKTDTVDDDLNENNQVESQLQPISKPDAVRVATRTFDGDRYMLFGLKMDGTSQIFRPLLENDRCEFFLVQPTVQSDSAAQADTTALALDDHKSEQATDDDKIIGQDDEVGEDINENKVLPQCDLLKSSTYIQDLEDLVKERLIRLLSIASGYRWCSNGFSTNSRRVTFQFYCFQRINKRPETISTAEKSKPRYNKVKNVDRKGFITVTVYPISGIIKVHMFHHRHKALSD